MLTIDAPELLKRYAKGERDFARIRLNNANLRGINLSDIDFSQADLSKADLRGTNLSYSSLKGANLKESLLERANLSYADLSRSNLTLARLTDACLDEAQLQGTFLTKACLTGASLRKAVLDKAHLNGAILHNAIVKEASLNSAYLIGAYLNKVNLQDASLVGAYLQGCRLDNANLEGASYDYSTQFDEDFDPYIAKMQRLEGTKVTELLDIFNYLNEMGFRYLGSSMTLKNWQKTQPRSPWFQQFSFDLSGMVSYSGDVNESVTIMDLYVCRKWFHQFIAESKKFIKQFDFLLDSRKLGFSLNQDDETLSYLS